MFLVSFYLEKVCVVLYMMIRCTICTPLEILDLPMPTWYIWFKNLAIKPTMPVPILPNLGMEGTSGFESTEFFEFCFHFSYKFHIISISLSLLTCTLAMYTSPPYYSLWTRVGWFHSLSSIPSEGFSTAEGLGFTSLFRPLNESVLLFLDEWWMGPCPEASFLLSLIVERIPQVCLKSTSSVQWQQPRTHAWPFPIWINAEG